MVLLDEPHVPTWDEINDEMYQLFGPQEERYDTPRYSSEEEYYEPIARNTPMHPQLKALQEARTRRMAGEAQVIIPTSAPTSAPANGRAHNVHAPKPRRIPCPTCPSRHAKRERNAERRSQKREARKNHPSFLERCGYVPGSGEVTQKVLNDMIKLDAMRAYNLLYAMGTMRNARDPGSGNKLIAQAKIAEKSLCQMINRYWK